MRIDSGTVGMDSARLYKSANASLTWGREGSVNGNGNPLSFFNNLFNEEEAKETESESENAPASLSEVSATMSFGAIDRLSVQNKSAKEEFARLHELSIRYILKLLFGRGTTEKLDDCSMESSDSETAHIPQYEVITKEYSQSYYYEESEATTFQAKGLVKTEDGRELDFNINVAMSRKFVSYYEERFSVTTLQACDPLVINTGRDVSEVRDMTFFFDLDMDGEREQISMLKEGSGFLALDKNHDGIINDGSELFGTKSQDGFKDLAEYDLDHNGWIDENDAIFDQLLIWSKDIDGNDILTTLKEANVGAICLDHVATQFSLTDQMNADQAYIRSSGVFLFEDGGVGTVQHVDMVS